MTNPTPRRVSSLRREPPPLRRASVVALRDRSPALKRITLSGPELVGLERGAPASSVRLLLPGPSGLVLPMWNGNEFLDADGTRPLLRTLTPLAVRDDGSTAQLDVDVVLHHDSPLTAWVRAAGVGDEVAISGTGAGYEVDPAAESFVLLGDESAVPAISVLMDELPVGAEVQVHVELREAAHAVTLPEHPGAQVDWHIADEGAPSGQSLVSVVEVMTAETVDAAVSTAEETSFPHSGESSDGRSIDGGTRVWVAGEAAAVQRIRKLLAAAGVPRSHAVVRGYWKVARPSRMERCS